MLRVLSCGLASLFASTALANECANHPFALTILSFAQQSGFEVLSGSESIEVQAQSILSPEGRRALVTILCAFQGVENERYRNAAIRTGLHLVVAPDIDGVDELEKRFAARLGVTLPKDSVALLRAEISIVEARIAASHAAIMADLSERQAVIDEQRKRLSQINEEIARLEARKAAADQRIDAADQRIDAVDRRIDAANQRIDAANAELALIRENIARMRAIRGEIETMIDVLERRKPENALD